MITVQSRSHKGRAPGLQRHRRGFTLIELLVASSLVSVVLGISSVFIAGLWRVENSLGQQDLSLTSLRRLMQQFRSDVHQASSVEFSGGTTESPAQKFNINLADGGKVEYGSEPNLITRVVRAGDEIKQRESYDIPGLTKSNWQVATTEGLNLASLSLVRQLQPGADEPSAERTIRIDAAVGVEPHELKLSNP